MTSASRAATAPLLSDPSSSAAWARCSSASLIIVVLVLGIRGCLNARAERGFENYVRDLASITTEAQQLSGEFFERLEDPGDLTELSLER